MLYDVLPPLFFIGSLGGIIFIISRIVTRLRRHELSTALHSAALSQAPAASGHLRPTAAHIRLFGSRLSLLKPMLITISVQSQRLTSAAKRLVIISWRRLPKKLPRLPRLPRFHRAVVVSQPIAAPPPAPAAPAKPAPPVTQVIAPAKPHITKKVVSPTFFQKKPRPSALETARHAWQQGDYAKVEEVLVPYLFKHPTDASGYVLLGKAAMQQDNWSDALEILEQAAALSHPPREVQALLGISAYHAGRLARALSALQRAHDQDPTNQEVLACLLKIARTMDNQALLHSLEQETVKLPAASPSVGTH